MSGTLRVGLGLKLVAAALTASASALRVCGVGSVWGEVGGVHVCWCCLVVVVGWGVWMGGGRGACPEIGGVDCKEMCR